MRQWTSEEEAIGGNMGGGLEGNIWSGGASSGESRRMASSCAMRAWSADTRRRCSSAAALACSALALSALALAAAASRCNRPRFASSSRNSVETEA